MANGTNKIFVDKMGGRSASEYIGTIGEIFYDPTVGDLRLSDGQTTGGKPIGGSDTKNGIYRRFQAGANIFRQNRNNGEFDMAQIFIHDAEARVDYINYTRDTNNDDFYVTGLIRDDANESNNWNATQVVVLNVYSATNGGLTAGDLRTFVRQFIDTVLYDDQDQRVTSPEQAKQLFYANIEKLTQSLPAGTLYPAFNFDDGKRMHWPEYNMVHADGSTEEPNYTASVKIFINPDTNDGPYPGWDSYTDCTNTQVTGGTGYAIGDKILANGGQMGGTDGVNDFTLTVTGLKNGGVTQLQMTNGGTNFYPSTYSNNTISLNGGNGGGATIYIQSCTANGEIVNWELRSDGANYEVGDTLTANFGGDDATFEVISVGTDGIDSWSVEGTAYLGSPYRAQYGYWPKFGIDDGLNDQYDGGNYISTNKGSSSYVVNISGNKMSIGYTVKSGINLQPGMFCVVRNPNDVTDESTFRLVSAATNDSDIWYIDNSFSYEGAQVRIDGIDYNNGNVNFDGSFGFGEGSGEYVVVYDQSIFAMMAFNVDGVNSVYYNGETGVDSNGTKLVEVLLGSADGIGDSKLIPQRLIYNSNYTLQTADIGKHVYNPQGYMQVVIPPDSVANFPVGSAITFVSSSDGIVEFNRDNNDTTQIWGAGFNQTSAYWAIPENSMATLLKVGPDRWIVSGAGLYNND